MAIPAYLWLKDDGGADIKGSLMYRIVKEALKSFHLVMDY